MAEYALMLVLIAVTAIGILRSLGVQTHSTYDNVGFELSKVGSEPSG